VNYFEEQYNTCQIKYGELKKQLADDMIAFTAPFRERIKEISNNDEYLRKVVRMGKEKAQAHASQTVKEVREIIGFRSF